MSTNCRVQADQRGIADLLDRGLDAGGDAEVVVVGDGRSTPAPMATAPWPLTMPTARKSSVGKVQPLGLTRVRQSSSPPTPWRLVTEEGINVVRQNAGIFWALAIMRSSRTIELNARDSQETSSAKSSTGRVYPHDVEKDAPAAELARAENERHVMHFLAGVDPAVVGFGRDRHGIAFADVFAILAEDGLAVCWREPEVDFDAEAVAVDGDVSHVTAEVGQVPGVMVAVDQRHDCDAEVWHDVPRWSGAASSRVSECRFRR